MIFGRKNYLPDLNVYQDAEWKWFAEEPLNRWGERRSFVKLEDGTFYTAGRGEPTKFDTLDYLMSALYAHAYDEHLEAIKKQLTYEKVKVRL